jgi:quercetin dioxygenase-like cupin family protein
MNQVLSLFQEARFFLPDGELEAARAEWSPHPAFPGVWLKHLVVGKDTQGVLSCHLVRVEKGKTIGRHVHDKSVELHEVVAGQGSYLAEDRETEYRPGVCMVIPAGAPHEVSAGQEDLFLLAKFAPALL